MRDNRTSQPASEYDANIRKTIPFYDLFQDNTLTLIEVINLHPDAWLDTGGGTGTFIQKAAAHFPSTTFTLADPSTAMLEIANKKLSAAIACTYLAAGTEEISCPSESFSIITAILAHHYLDEENRRRAVANCFRMLKKGGGFVTFETILPNSEQAKQIGLQRWRQAQLRQGKDPAAVDRHIKRLGVEVFPIRIAEHLELLHNTGFSTVEVFWKSEMQAGFYAIK